MIPWQCIERLISVSAASVVWALPHTRTGLVQREDIAITLRNLRRDLKHVQGGRLAFSRAYFAHRNHRKGVHNDT